MTDEEKAKEWVRTNSGYSTKEFHGQKAIEAFLAGAEFGYNKANERLAEAKEIIKKFSEFVNNEVEFDSEHPQEHTDLWNELCEKAEHFLREVEK